MVRGGVDALGERQEVEERIEKNSAVRRYFLYRACGRETAFHEKRISDPTRRG